MKKYSIGNGTEYRADQLSQRKVVVNGHDVWDVIFEGQVIDTLVSRLEEVNEIE